MKERTFTVKVAVSDQDGDLLDKMPEIIIDRLNHGAIRIKHVIPVDEPAKVTIQTTAPEGYNIDEWPKDDYSGLAKTINALQVNYGFSRQMAVKLVQETFHYRKDRGVRIKPDRDEWLHFYPGRGFKVQNTENPDN